MMTYEQAYEYVTSFSKSGEPVKDLVRFVILMRVLGNPHDKLKIIHVAGTNGKGSVCEYITGSLRSAGKTTGKFTSPYIECMEERIQINGKFISRQAFALLCEQVKNAVEVTELEGFSQFEILTAIAFLYFYKEQVDCAVIEAGIGGLLDCTNAVTPAASVITSVDFDHTDILGETLPQIARHKAGIIKPSVPCIFAPLQQPGALQVIEAKCKEYNSTLIIPDMNRVQVLHMDLTDLFFSYKGMNYHLMMSGEHQLRNALCAIEACAVLGIQYSHVFTGLEKAKLHARMEAVKVNGVDFILDGSHNPSAMSAAAKMLEAEKRPAYAVVGMLSSKDWPSALERIMHCFEYIVFVDGFMPGSVSAQKLYHFAVEHGVKCEACNDITQAIKTVINKAGEGIAMATGSLYLASEIRRILTTLNKNNQ